MPKLPWISNDLFACLLCVAAVALHGCDDGCPTLESCDIRETSCQRDVARVTACLRDSDAVTPEIEVVDAEAFIQDQVDHTEPETEDERDLRRSLALLGLAPAEHEEEQVRTYWNTLGAFYSRTTRKVTILDRGAPLDGAGSVTTLVHELVHAMQHTEIDDDFLVEHSRTYDMSLAFSAMREGEAVLYEDLAALDGFNLEEREVHWRSLFATYRETQREVFYADDDKYALASRRFVYAFGGDYVNEAWKERGNEAVREIYGNLPGSTANVMRGYRRYPWDEYADDSPDTEGVPTAIDGYEHFATRRLGDWMFDAFVATWADAAYPTWSHLTVYGDVFSAWRNPSTGDVASVWRVRLGSDDDLYTALVDHPDITVTQIDTDLVIVASTNPDLASTIIDSIEWSPAPTSDWTTPSDAARAYNSDLCAMGAQR